MLAGKHGKSGTTTLMLLAATAYFIGNFIIILFFISALFHLLSYGSEDFQISFSIFSSIIGFAYFQKFTIWLFNLKVEIFNGLTANKRIIIACANLALLFTVVILHHWIIPYCSEQNFKNGDLAYKEGNYASALKSFNRAITQNPKNIKNHIGIARVHEALGNSNEAIINYRLGIQELDKRYSIYNDLSRLYMEDKKNYHKALNLLLRILSDLENDTTGHPNLDEVEAVINKNIAWVYWKLNLPSEAKWHIDASIDIFKKIQGALDQYPGTYCIFALTQIDLEKEKRDPKIEELCFKGKDKLSGAEIELYVDLKQKVQSI